MKAKQGRIKGTESKIDKTLRDAAEEWLSARKDAKDAKDREKGAQVTMLERMKKHNRRSMVVAGFTITISNDPKATVSKAKDDDDEVDEKKEEEKAEKKSTAEEMAAHA